MNPAHEFAGLLALLAGFATPLAQAATATVYYYLPYQGWATADMHDDAAGAWTTAPGRPMAAACAGWVSRTVDLGSAAQFEAVFDDGTTVHWDHPTAGGNYLVPAGAHQVREGVLRVNAGNPCAPNRMGAIYAAKRTTFSLWSPDTSDVRVVVGGVAWPMARVADVDGYTDVYAVDVPGDLHLKTYHFQVRGVNVRDPYGVMVDAGGGEDVVVDPARAALKSGAAAPPALAAREDAVIYEVHVRDFTIDPSSGVPADKRGRYMGMIERGTTVGGAAGAPKTGIDHLVDLGVTHVQLMPTQDFASCSPAIVAANPACYNWGYDPVNYNVPEERYSATPGDPVARMREFKTMVDGLHRRGLRVVMDVVYNHSNSKEMFSAITPKYYTATDFSNTGNSIDVEQPMVARMIRDSLEYWVREYGVDGFRFDLMGVFDYAVVDGWAAWLDAQFPGRELLVYGEPWNAGVPDPAESRRVRPGTVGAIVGTHVGIFNGSWRDALKGPGDDGSPGGFIFAQGGAGTAVADGVAASGRVVKGTLPLADLWDSRFSMDPEQTINYVDVHDDLCLADRVSAWAAANGHADDTAYQQRIQEFALSTVLTAQGIPFLHGGSEMLRTKQGVANSYQSPDAVNAYDWNWRSAHADTFALVKKVLKLRRQHAALRMHTWDDVAANVVSSQKSASLVVTQIDAAANGDSWTTALVVMNAGPDAVIALPAGKWKVALEQSSASAGNNRVVSGSYTAAGTAVSVLFQ